MFKLCFKYKQEAQMATYCAPEYSGQPVPGWPFLFIGQLEKHNMVGEARYSFV